ncbi:hypothetical protein [Pseudomonas sp. MH10]|uniref:hypothetical protein n=1 Tax=Pseudomonas sp. MH10 TaxID=3048627 RepID=UPI002AC9B421|nr:hypothetical protein [Pseudomonas sp. MH10]MEB0043412.1 hypothetical protein [Pseudomonas sp. MH10]WPX63584.1 hypothetical protein RHM59_22350 [Pseudomonas sp. MH10]
MFIASLVRAILDEFLIATGNPHVMSFCFHFKSDVEILHHHFLTGEVQGSASDGSSAKLCAIHLRSGTVLWGW